MKQLLLNVLFASIAACIILVNTGCKKSKTGSNLSTGTGSYTFNGITVNTNDTLAPDVFSGGKDVTMWPTSSNNIVFVYNIPTQSSGSVPLSDGTQTSGTAPYILGTYGQIRFASITGTGSVTKTDATSFSFSCMVSDETNPSNTYMLTGSGSY